MNNTTLPVNMDVDPLSYEYPSYSYPHPAQYPYPVKDETYYPNYIPNGHPDYNQLTPLQSKEETENKTEIKDVKTVPTRRRKVKDKAIKSAYCSEKITDAGFPFYGCSVCNISYKALHELDQHVTIHKNRMTSYRLRLRNQYKKKQLKKEKKRLKKIIKKEIAIEIEIKPEDGYIGNEKAADFINNEFEQKPEYHGEDTKSGISSLNLNLSHDSGLKVDSLNNGNGANIGGVSNGNEGNVGGVGYSKGANVDSKSDIGANGDGKSDANGAKVGDISKANGPNVGSVKNANVVPNVGDKTKANKANVGRVGETNGVTEGNRKGVCDNSMSKDEEIELNNLEKIYKCFACRKQFTLSYYLKLHVRSHTGKIVFIFSCHT